MKYHKNQNTSKIYLRNLFDFINKMTLKDLDITYEDLVIKFMSEGLLPKNYLINR